MSSLLAEPTAASISNNSDGSPDNAVCKFAHVDQLALSLPTRAEGDSGSKIDAADLQLDAICSEAIRQVPTEALLALAR